MPIELSQGFGEIMIPFARLNAKGEIRFFYVGISPRESGIKWSLEIFALDSINLVHSAAMAVFCQLA